MYLGCIKLTEYNLGESVVLNVAISLNDTYCTLQFFVSSNLIQESQKWWLRI